MVTVVGIAGGTSSGKTSFAQRLRERLEPERCLIIAPGSLNEQWQAELDQKFNLQFEIPFAKG